MSLPNVDEGLGFITYDNVATNSALLSKQQSDLSGNVTQRQFCIDAFHLAGNRDVSNALIVSDDITIETDNVLAFIGSNVKSVQRTYLSNQIISSLSQNFISNSYKMIEGIQLSNPLNSKFLVAPPFTQLTETKIVASDRQADDNFGISVAISGNYAIVGAYYEDNQRGAAYIFERVDGSWSQKQKIVAGDRYEGDNFGNSVAISGNYAIVGAYYEDNQRGAAYIFERTSGNWSQKQKIVASDKGAGDQFGRGVAISGNYAIVGAVKEDPDDINAAGAAYIFERTSGNWSQKQKIVASDSGSGDEFGISVAIDGSYAIIGAHQEDHDASGNTYKAASGSAYIFEIDTSGNWSEKQKIVASDRGESDNFGYSVAIDGSYAIIGAHYEYPGDTVNAGAAYIFERDTSGNWSEIQKIVASDRESSDYFGTSVAISGNYVIVGAYGEDPGDTGNAGAAYIFEG